MKGIKRIKDQMNIDELSEKVIGACFEVSNELGIGFLESVYGKALLVALSDKGVPAKRQMPIKVKFRDVIVGEFFADILVGTNLIVELKAVKKLLPEHAAQVLNYLKASELGAGLLVNFGQTRVEYRRFDNRFKPL